MRTIKLSYNILSQALIRSKNTIPNTNKHKIQFIILEMGGDCPRTQIPIGGNLQIESERPDDMGKTSESLAELGGNQSGYAQEISNRKFETPSNGVIGRPGGG